MKKVLYFEGAGCEGTQRNDMENCRIRTAFTNDLGQMIYLEMFEGVRRTYITTGKNGRTLKHPKEVKEEGYAWIDHCHYITDDAEIDDDNNSRLPFERNVDDLRYTKADILKFINEKMNCSFDEIVILPWLSGYGVHASKRTRTSEAYNLMEKFNYSPELTEKRRQIYYVDATKYFDEIYKRHAEENPSKRYLYKPMSNSHSILGMTDATITIRSHTYKELINDDERDKVFEV